MMSLNVGAGKSRYGDIRIDLVGHPDIIADAHYLPLRANLFSEVEFSHVLEHLNNPNRALKEALRVGSRVHARFPYKWDSIPFTMSVFTSFDPHGILLSLNGMIRHFLTQLRILDDPLHHRWLIQPFGKAILNKRYLFSFFASGRKARYLSRFAFEVNAEWECWFPD